MNFSGMSDRDILIHLATKQAEAEIIRKERNEQNDKRFDDLVDEDDKLHHRVNEVNKSIFNLKIFSTGVSAVAGFFGGLVGYFTAGGNKP